MTLTPVFSCEFSERLRTTASVLLAIKLLFSTISKLSTVFSWTFLTTILSFVVFRLFLIENWTFYSSMSSSTSHIVSIFRGFFKTQSLTNFAKCLVINVRLGSKYVCDF